ncbi:MAG: hypothetical protein KJ886_00450 [Candidatus Thermoplasmatota archaeon]|nr:hypothetical protein [Candidatus Thermoplasmatota archaeon]MBU4255626.1 hypothetical protein [Candidatus Thermoplasmatota archaeon]
MGVDKPMMRLFKITPAIKNALEILRNCGLMTAKLDFYGVKCEVVSNSTNLIRHITSVYNYFIDNSTVKRNNIRLFAFTNDSPIYEEVMKKIFPHKKFRYNCLIVPNYGLIYMISKYSNLAYYTTACLIHQVEVRLDNRFFLLHAAGLAKDHIGVIIAGEQNCGKTTLTLGLLSRGFKFSSDDVVLFERKTKKVKPFPRMLNIRRDTIETIKELERMLDVEQPFKILDEERWFLQVTENVVDEFIPNMLLFPCGFEKEARVESVPKTKACLKLLHHCISPITPEKYTFNSATNFESASDLVEIVKCYNLYIGELEETLDLITSTGGKEE